MRSSWPLKARLHGNYWQMNRHQSVWVMGNLTDLGVMTGSWRYNLDQFLQQKVLECTSIDIFAKLVQMRKHTSMLISTTDKLMSDLINASKSMLIQDALFSSVQQHQIQLNKVSELKLRSDYLEVNESNSDEIWPLAILWRPLRHDVTHAADVLLYTESRQSMILVNFLPLKMVFTVGLWTMRW